MSKVAGEAVEPVLAVSAALRNFSPLFIVLVVVAIGDFSSRVLVSGAIEKPFDQPDSLAIIFDENRLTKKSYQYYSRKLAKFDAPMDGPMDAEGKPNGQDLADKVSNAVVSDEHPELNLLGIFREEDFFAVFRTWTAGENTFDIVKVRVGSKIESSEIKSITKFAVTLSQDDGDLELLELFQSNEGEEVSDEPPI